MFFLNRHEFSLAPKSLFLVATSAAGIASWWMMFPWVDPPWPWAESYLLHGDSARRGLVLFCLVTYALRVTITSLVFLKRKLIWTEALVITFFMCLALLAFARKGGANPHPVGILEILGMTLYLGGSLVNTWSEYQRLVFKADPANRGKLYTEGLFSLARHINYLGDVVLFAGLALVTGGLILLLIPLFMLLNFLLFIIPRHEAYLSAKYGAQFHAYCKQTSKLIPFVY